MRPPIGCCLVAIALCSPARADCVAGADAVGLVKLDGVSRPLYDGRGKRLPGCLLHAGGSVIGYARDERLCQMQPGAAIEVRLARGCCDSGRDTGDAECVARTAAWLSQEKLFANGVLVHSR